MRFGLPLAALLLGLVVGLGLGYGVWHDTGSTPASARTSGQDRVVGVTRQCEYVVREGERTEQRTAYDNDCSPSRLNAISGNRYTPPARHHFIVTVRTPQGGSYVVDSLTLVEVGSAWPPPPTATATAQP